MGVKLTKQIIGLIRLANNNNQEHEANSAARMACKLIGQQIDNHRPQPLSQSPPTHNVWDDVLNNYYKQREQQAQEPSKVTCIKCGVKFNLSRFALPIGPYYCDRCRLARDQEQARQDYTYYRDYSWYTGKWDFGYEAHEEKPKRILECTKCKQKKETIFVGHPAVFICNTCQWSIYEEMKSK